MLRTRAVYSATEGLRLFKKISPLQSFSEYKPVLLLPSTRKGAAAMRAAANTPPPAAAAAAAGDAAAAAAPAAAASGTAAAATSASPPAAQPARSTLFRLTPKNFSLVTGRAERPEEGAKAGAEAAAGAAGTSAPATATGILVSELVVAPPPASAQAVQHTEQPFCDLLAVDLPPPPATSAGAGAASAVGAAAAAGPTGPRDPAAEKLLQRGVVALQCNRPLPPSARVYFECTLLLPEEEHNSELMVVLSSLPADEALPGSTNTSSSSSSSSSGSSANGGTVKVTSCSTQCVALVTKGHPSCEHSWRSPTTLALPAKLADMWGCRTPAAAAAAPSALAVGQVVLGEDGSAWGQREAAARARKLRASERMACGERLGVTLDLAAGVVSVARVLDGKLLQRSYLHSFAPFSGPLYLTLQFVTQPRKNGEKEGPRDPFSAPALPAFMFGSTSAHAAKAAAAFAPYAALLLKTCARGTGGQRGGGAGAEGEKVDEEAGGGEEDLRLPQGFTPLGDFLLSSAGMRTYTPHASISIAAAAAAALTPPASSAAPLLLLDEQPVTPTKITCVHQPAFLPPPPPSAAKLSWLRFLQRALALCQRRPFAAHFEVLQKEFGTRKGGGKRGSSSSSGGFGDEDDMMAFAAMNFGQPAPFNFGGSSSWAKLGSRRAKGGSLKKQLQQQVEVLKEDGPAAGLQLLQASKPPKGSPKGSAATLAVLLTPDAGDARWLGCAWKVLVSWPEGVLDAGAAAAAAAAGAAAGGGGGGAPPPRPAAAAKAAARQLPCASKVRVTFTSPVYHPNVDPLTKVMCADFPGFAVPEPGAGEEGEVEDMFGGGGVAALVVVALVGALGVALGVALVEGALGASVPLVGAGGALGAAALACPPSA